jgi:hypothetical protein
MAYRPDQGVGFAFMINAGNGTAFERISRLVRDYITRDQVPADGPPVMPVAEFVRDRAGWYRPDNPRVEKTRFLERLAFVRLTATDSGLVVKPLLGEASYFVPVGERLFRRPWEPVATLALIDDPDNGRDQAMEWMGYLLPAEFHRAWTPVVWAELGGAGLFLLALASTVLFALVWLPRWVFGKLKDAPQRGVRVWPLLAVLSLVVWVGVVIVNIDDAINVLGRPTPWAWTMFVTSLLFPLCAVVGVLAARGAKEANRFVRWHALLASAIFVVAALYLTWFGILGWRTWS